MGRSSPQLNIRSSFARERATELARRTGMSTTQVVEEALRAYSPPLHNGEGPLPPGLIRKGNLLVFASTGRTITVEEVNAAIDEDRNSRGLVEP